MLCPKRGTATDNALSFPSVEEFDDIRPYRDDEVPEVLRRVVADPAAARGVARFLLPGCLRHAPGITCWALARALAWRVRNLRSVDDLHVELGRWFGRLIRRTTTGLTWSGLEALEPGAPHLFVSNHRDIALDSAFMNYALWSSGRRTSQIAVGENLFTHAFANDLMRLNRGFVVPRGGGSSRTQYAGMRRTSRYIRSALEAGESVWIAQRDGRAKDGIDRTEPALLKLFLLAWRGECDAFGDWLRQVRLIPVSTSYELDPCAPVKARELYLRARDGGYDKPEGEDHASMVRGILGFKGAVHVEFGRRVEGDFETAEDLADHLDRVIVGNLRMYPTHVFALEGSADLGAGVGEAFLAALQDCPAEHREYVLLQYANQLRNQRRLTAGAMV